ncbi:MAG: 3-deoxy-7-phosphoheptulonate synthase [Phycisphaerae bacterium]|nr:3-deoxy-7-phosphoheptulonate synthase [Phycisphaerae bacterium]
MIVVMKPGSQRGQIDGVIGLLREMGAQGRPIDGAQPPVIEILECNGKLDRRRLEQASMVERVVDGATPLLAVGRKAGEQTLEVPLGRRAVIGGQRLAVVAGPCSVEDEGRLLETATAVAAAGAVGLRGGAFKPRTSPYAFQGLGEDGLRALARVREKTGLAIVTEVMSPERVACVAEYADVLQVGSRNMHNSPLLRAVGEQGKPVLLKRGWSATLEEFLLAAEYILRAGNPNVILCERGIRTHEEYVRNTMALAVVPEVKRLSRLPIIVDPSHGTGRAHLVEPMSRAAIACGADGLLIEVHPSPEQAWSDGAQTLNFQQFRDMMTALRPIAAACGRSLEAGDSPPTDATDA